MSTGLPMLTPALSMAAALLWLVAAALLPRLREARRAQALVALTGAGVPLIGWLTYCCGPLAGMLALIGAVVVLILSPLRRHRRLRRHQRTLRPGHALMPGAGHERP
ncbi:DUF2484 family protein [Paracoccus jiaweipingae]|uniref:DUF2484 family protein n=1 Tax=unclassified Paracoccus (in: a-proteobacteria) TaxID=2688777 RepID=UPI003797DBFD